MQGWDDLREVEAPALSVDQAVKDLDKNFVRTFSTEEGKVVLDYLVSMTLDQPTWYPGEDPSHGYAREGQNSIVREIMKRIERGRNYE